MLRICISTFWLTLRIPVLCGWFAVPAAVFIAEPAAANVTKTYQKGLKLFKQKKYKRAYRVLRINAKKYSSHYPTHALLGRIMFRLGKVRGAIKYFKKVPIDMVTREFAYEYGIAMFQDKQYNKAIKGFGKVRSGSKLANYAYFYAGVANFRLKRWSLALQLLRKARRLPQRLRSSKRRLLREAKKNQRAEVRGGAAAQQINPYLIVPQPPPPALPATPSEPPTDAVAKAEPEPEPPPPPESGFSSSVTPAVEVKQSQEARDFYGLASRQSDSQNVVIKVGFVGKYEASPRSFGDQPYVSIAIDGENSKSSSSVKSAKNVQAAPDDPTIIERVESKNSSSTAGAVSVNPEAGYPVTADIDVAVGFKFSEKYPELKADGKEGSQGPYGKVGLSIAGFDLGVSAAQTDALKEDVPVKSTLTVAADVSKSIDTVSVGLDVESKQHTQLDPPGEEANPVAELKVAADASKSWESFTLGLAVSQVTKTPAAGKQLISAGGSKDENPESSLRIGINGTQSFDFGASLSFTVTQVSNDPIYVEVEVPSATGTDTGDGGGNAADGEAAEPKKVPAPGASSGQELNLTLKLSPLDWLSGSIAYDYKKYAAEAQDPKAQATYEKTLAEMVTKLTISIGVSTSF